MRKPRPLSLFQGYGVELEYMIVDRDTLSVAPVCDELIRSLAGTYTSEIERGEISWSNELALHVIELKTNGPAQSLDGLAAKFQSNVQEINSALAPLGAALMPTSMHPWMNPGLETKLWPHEYNPIYESYNRIFDCRGHGWSNLQSVHINLPFANDGEFERLHAAIRVLLPIMPALAASSPLVERQATGILDNRMEFYRTNSKRIPSITGSVIPEAVFSQKNYDERIFQRMYRDIAPHDPDGILQDEWLNARGAIARFDRNAIEIRVLDIQESPAADLAIVWLICETLKALVEERWSGLEEQKGWRTDPLAEIFRACVKNAENHSIPGNGYAALFGRDGTKPSTAGELWRHIARQLTSMPVEFRGSLNAILEHGTLSRRILRQVGEDADANLIAETYRQLTRHLHEGSLFVP